MVQVAIEGELALKASDIEFQLPRPSYTIDTLTYLQEKHPGHKFSVIMGSDSFQNVAKWKNYQRIVEDYDLYVYIRAEFPAQTAGFNRVFILDAPLLQISATRIREYIKQRKSIRFLVPDKVMEEIDSNGYYRWELLVR